MEAVRWHPAVLEIIVKAMGQQMKIGGLWELLRPSLRGQAEAVLNALLQEGYEIRLMDSDPPPVPLAVDPQLMIDFRRAKNG